MFTTCIAVVDPSYARLLVWRRDLDVRGADDALVEKCNLVDGIRTGRRDDELDAQFARDVLEQIAALAHSVETDRVILCATRSMLGQLRRARGTCLDGLIVDELGRDLVNLSRTQLRTRLAVYGLLPPPPAHKAGTHAA